MLEGNCTWVADCVKAYLQADLLDQDAETTYVCFSEELWLPSWKGVYRRPTVPMRKALYGNPQAAAFWDMHLKQVLLGDLGLQAVDSRPSVYLCPQTKLLVVVYVDDVLISGPRIHQQKFWDSLKKKLELEDVEEISSFIGRSHHLSQGSCALNMVDYAEQAIQLYAEVVGEGVKFRIVSTPYVSGALNDLDYQTDGQIGHKASSVLMKLLWLTRLARPDLAFAVSSLASQVARWSRNSDKQLFRLVSHLWSTKNLRMTFSVHDSPAFCSLCTRTPI